MPMSPYFVRCYVAGCEQAAVYKIAGRWSDGLTSELKTYSLSCRDCLPVLFNSAAEKHACCRLAPGESLAQPSIFLLANGTRDRQLIRCEEIEASCLKRE